MNTIKYIAIGILLALTFMLVSFQYISFSKYWYDNEFKLYNIQANDTQVDNLFLYLNDQQVLEKSFYSEREILHLQDVQGLVKKEKNITLFIVLLFYIVLILSLVMQSLSEFIKTLFFSNLTAIVIYVVLGGVLYFQFNQIFLAFHQISFNNDYWQLDPKIDNLINIFPPQIFFDLIKQTFALSIIAHTVLFLFSGIIYVGILIRKAKSI